MRSQYCREHIDKVAEECGLERSTVSDVKQAAKFCDEHSDLSEFSTRAVMALIRIKDDQVRDMAITLVKTSLHLKPEKKLTEREVRAIIDQADLEVRKELMAEKEDAGAGMFDKYVSPEKPAEIKTEIEPVESATYVALEPEPVTDPDPEYEPPNEYLIRQIDRCRHRRCPELVDDETHTLCKVMEVHREKGTPWCRYDCPLRPVVQDPKPYDGKAAGPTFKPKTETASAVIHRPVAPSQGTSDTCDYTITARRYAQSVIRQVIRHGMAETEEEAAQKVFDLGIEKMLDEVDRQVQRQADEDAAVFEEVDA